MKVRHNVHSSDPSPSNCFISKQFLFTDILFDSYSCDKCFEFCSLLLNHQIEHHNSVNPERRISFLDLLKQTGHRTEPAAYTDTEYDYEIVATLVKIPKIKQEFTIVVEPTIQLSNISTNVSSNEESAPDFDGNDNDDCKSISSCSDDHEYKVKRKEPKNRLRRASKSNVDHLKVECDICGKFYSHKGIVNHRKKAHPKIGIRQSASTDRQQQPTETNAVERDRCDVKKEDTAGKVGTKKRVEKYYICDLCNDTTSSKLKILKHFKSVHRSLFANGEPVTRRRKYDKQCPCCSKIINGLVAYRCHMKQYHPETTMQSDEAREKRAADNSLKILCDICGKGFSSDRLKVHKQSHSEARPHKCTICDRDYRQVCMAAGTGCVYESKYFMAFFP